MKLIQQTFWRVLRRFHGNFFGINGVGSMPNKENNWVGDKGSLILLYLAIKSKKSKNIFTPVRFDFWLNIY